jgi:hypothetical protein
VFLSPPPTHPAIRVPPPQPGAVAEGTSEGGCSECDACCASCGIVEQEIDISHTSSARCKNDSGIVLDHDSCAMSACSSPLHLRASSLAENALNEQPTVLQHSGDDENFCSQRTSEHAQHAAEQMTQIGDLIFEMTAVQRTHLARAWDVHFSSAKDLHDHCVSMTTSAQPGFESLCRELAMRRFFSDDAPRHLNADDDGRASPAQDCRDNRARSASPRANMTTLRFDCSICLGSVAAMSTVVMPCCGFELCRACAKQSLQCIMAACNANNRRIPCLHCSSNIFSYPNGQHMTQALVGPAAMLAWRAKLALNSVPNCRQCSACNRIQLVTSKSPASPSVMCSCGHVTCLIHGDSHPGTSCPLPSPEQIESEDRISRISKRCPGCKVATERNGGCSHMSCSECGCSWCWTCAKSRRSSRSELLNTASDAVMCTNWLSALLFRIICYAAGPSSVFFIADDRCICGSSDTRWLEYEWQRSGHYVNVSSQPSAQWIVSSTLLIAVHLFYLSQRMHHCALLLRAYAAVAALYILAALCSHTFGIVAATVRFCYRSMHHHYPQFFSQVTAAVLSKVYALFTGICVAWITYAVHPILCQLGRTRHYTRYQPLQCSDFKAAAKVAVPALLTYLYYMTPLEPQHSTWILHFWIVWAALQLHLVIYPHVSILNSHNACDDPISWGLVCGALSIALSLVMSTTRFICCLDAAVCVLCVLGISLKRRLNSDYHY